MTSPPDDTTTDTSAIIAALRAERDAALAREAALAKELAAHAAALAQRNSEYGERIDHQAATIDVLKAMSASPGDARPVFELIVERARSFCGADHATAALLQDDMLHLQAHSGMSAAYGVGYAAQFPRPVDTSTMFGRAILSRDVMQTGNLRAERDLFASQMQTADFHSIVAVPILRKGTPIGAIALGQNASGGFTDTQIELLKTFAEQAVIAITSAETYRALQTRTSDLQETLEYQTAISDVLKVISRSAFDLQPVLDALVETAARLCDADNDSIATRDGEVYRVVASFGLTPQWNALVRTLSFRPGRDTITGRTLLERQVIQIADITADPEYRLTGAATVGNLRTLLGVPLLRDGNAIGVMKLSRCHVEPFTERQIELVRTFADQTVIAMENTRLITEQREALEQQTATAEVLQVINSSPGDLAPVFDAMLEKATRLCEAEMGTLWTYDGEYMQPAAMRGAPPPFAEFLKRGPHRPNSAQSRILRGERVIHSVNTTEGEAYRSGDPLARAAADLGGIRTILVVSLRKDDAVRGTIGVYRQEVRPFTDKQISLLENFAAQAVIAMENARLLNEQREALEQQTATAEVLQVINANPGNLAPVFDAILEKAHSLCGVALGELELYEDGKFRTVAMRGVSGPLAELLRQPFTPPPNSPLARLLAGEPVIQIADLFELARQRPDDRGAQAGAHYGLRTVLFVPLRKDDALLGYITAYRQEVRSFSEKEIALLQNFAAQAVIAMENTRLITEISEALEQQTATAEVLGVINSSPGDLRPVFDAMLQRATRLCGTAIGSFYSYNGETFQVLASTIGDTGRTIQPSPGNTLWRIAHGESVVQIADIETEPAYRVDAVGQMRTRLAGTRTALAVALRKDETLVGAITTGHPEVRPFSDKEIALLQNFAAQAVIAMENARLLTEQREALEQQTAISEIFQVINASPGELTPVFSAMLDKALRLCEAASGGFFTYDGEHFRTEATQGVPPALAAFREKNPPTARRLLERRGPVHNVDLRTDPDYLAGDASRRAVVELGGARTMLNVPLLKDRTVLGFIAIYRQEVRAFSDKQIALVENFAAQAVIAMENARLLQELRARTNELGQRQEELRVTFENMGDGVAMFDETPRLVAWNRKFQDILDLPDGVLAESLTFAEYVRYLAERGEYGEADPEEQIRRLTENADQYRAFERLRPDGRVIEIRHNPVPSGGFVLIYSDITERKRSEEEIRAARDAAEIALRELRTAQANLIQAEKMASLGQLTAGIAHEIKNPLNFVNNFSALSTELIDELRDVLAPEPLGETARTEVDDLTALLKGNLEKVVQHGQRADGIVRSMLDHSRGSSGERRMVDLNALIDEALNLAYHGARAQDQSFNITLERDFAEGISPIEVNPQDMTRVFLNLFSNGFYAVGRRASEGGDAGFVPTLKVTTVDASEAVDIRVRDNGIGIPGDIRDKLFQPFFTTKPTGEGTGLGLSITYDIVTQQHGGSITLDSKVGDYSEFTIRLPRKP